MGSGDYTIENLYEPSYDSPNFKGEVSHYLGKKNLISAGQMGMTVDPRMANQLAQLSSALNVGTSAVELGTLDIKTFDTIPKQHFEEIRRKAKLAEAQISIHAPIQDMDPSGFGERGWEESKQKLVERQLKDVIDKAAMIDSIGNMPVTIHGSNTSGSTYKMEGKEKKYEILVGVDKSSGQLVPMKETIQYHPGGNLESGEKMDPMTALRSHNSTSWRKEVDGVLFEKETAERILSDVYPVIKNIYSEIKLNPGKSSEIFNQLPSQQKELILKTQTADAHIHQADLSVNSLFDKAYQYGGRNKEEKEEIRKELKKIADEYDKSINGGYATKDYREIIERANANKGQLSGKDEKKYFEIISARNDLQKQSFAIQNFAEKLRRFNPEMITPMEEFATEKASETFANVAMHSYKNHGEGAPVVSIENLYQGMGFSQGKDLKELVEKSQERFVEKAIADGMDKSKAEQISRKLIGVTFDVGHLNLSKAHGFTDEQLVKEAEQIKKHIKHVHITDNFGYTDSHLPIGMGNVPVQALLEALGDEGERARKINEVGGWFEHFKTNPFQELLGGAGSQIYSTGDGPNWAQTSGFQQSYLEGYGQMLPDTHYQTFGAGFSQLPSSLGGQRQQGGGRMGGGF